MDYTAEQLKAAYALNLCTVSVSQIIDYNDINIMEQEYEAILNNLNLEQMPKDEALLNILKQILDTITFFRIQEKDKYFIEAEYQQKMKNAIWSAVPNIGMIVAGGNPVTMAVSLASQVGIGYMNYRKTKSDTKLEEEKQRWELERTAIEQFNGLRRELFDTAWRLSAAHNFPDNLRLTERQIKQYNNILMDNDLIRKYFRLSAIADSFAAYPPFWYHYGNTANAISRADIPLSENTRLQYRNNAKDHFLQYRASNQYGLLREDAVSASCALELVDLLNIDTDKELISELLEEAIRYSGRANDVLQLTAITYLKLNDQKSAANILSQLVNEQYNTILNAQLLSSIFVAGYVKTNSIEMMSRYEILKHQVGPFYLYPMPRENNIPLEDIEVEFVAMQKKVLHEKYMITLKSIIDQYLVSFGKLIPVANPEAVHINAYYLGSEQAIHDRKYEMTKVFSNSDKAEAYKQRLRDSEYVFSLFDLLNDLYETCCSLEVMSENTQELLARDIEVAIGRNKEMLNDLRNRINANQFDLFDMEKLLNIKFTDITTEFFRDFTKIISEYVDSRKEMQDFALAEESLSEFCQQHNLPDPAIMFGKEGNNPVEIESIVEKRFDMRLLGDEPVNIQVEEESKIDSMIRLVQAAEERLITSEEKTELYISGDPRIERYLRKNEKLKINGKIMANTVAILDDKSEKGDYDIIFTTYGMIPVKGGAVKKNIAYKNVAWSTGKVPQLMIDGKYENEGVDLQCLYELSQELKEYEKEMSDSSSSFKLPDFINPFIKK